jgi:hypothetical protein
MSSIALLLAAMAVDSNSRPQQQSEKRVAKIRFVELQSKALMLTSICRTMPEDMPCTGHGEPEQRRKQM